MYNTDKKEKLIQLFQENKEQSFSSIYLVKLFSENMNKTTVYRQLKSLEEKNIIRKNYNEQQQAYEYQYVEDCMNHLHLKCNSCGKVIHLKCNDADLFVQHILENHGFMINQLTSTLSGLCKECISKC